ncbi:pyruvate dehydrogenase (acetyl-transferring) E1 component subunit alpha [Microbacterium sp. dk485]|uniref:pyruvate dehydrogenase (acetyl-transferring) E1 component subunit alpha n=1 Tax=Microbacterium sp. dk485 TaxID=2560021 RepID=UPI001073B7AD|nr:pyruvate dehydrogenase (acetyl-transferring) E1 component subunit alpha [Microbacterium sp. dk485]TFV82318.1 pyruvate dehydrogenase (acetyl-transferring) E1 component subunit alpha [Microbacterium sp. dk485]
MLTPAPVPDLALSVDDAARVLTPDGERVPDATLDPWLGSPDPALLRALYRDMVLTRRVDAEGFALQRQGQLGLWPPCRGQEAVQIGTTHALAAVDMIFPSYRETGVVLARGARPEEFVLAWRGESHTAYDTRRLRMAPMQVIIGAHALHATGYAMGIQRDGADEIAVAYFGDGATSQGDVNEALVFSASYQAPVVFVCSNNQWAISEPVDVQSRVPLAARAPGFGIPSLRVDGNDVLACYAAMRWARERARRGEGPTFLEAVTYRMGPHTTADDPTRYRDAAEVERWERRDPITRFETYLRTQGLLDDDAVAEVAAAADMLAAAVRAACIGAQTRPGVEVLDDVYAEPHSGLAEERREYAAYLAGFAETEESA